MWIPKKKHGDLSLKKHVKYSIILLGQLAIHREDTGMVPESIRKIKRPLNTIVQATKNPNVYMVIKRIGCKYVDERRIPVNGPVVGHIIDGKYVSGDLKVGIWKQISGLFVSTDGPVSMSSIDESGNIRNITLTEGKFRFYTGNEDLTVRFAQKEIL